MMVIDFAPTDQGISERSKGFVNVITLLDTHQQLIKLVLGLK